MMKKLQKLGKALMLPVAALPICGILMGLGYAIAPGVMGVPGAATILLILRERRDIKERRKHTWV